ncbi:MAG: oligosaccharide flippase family protein [Acidimicrobiia bacterium]|nr:oligosaccharide flippase family protein [Acidimicrobiia bacterium]
MTGLRRQALEGGAYVLVRQVAGSGLRFLGILVLTRIIGPDDYGEYVGALAMAVVLNGLSNLGIDAFLIRQEAEPAKEAEDQAGTLLLLAGTATAAVAAASLALLSGRLFDAAFTPPLLVLLVFLPVQSLRVPATARLERAFRYRSLTLIELSADVGGYLLAIPLALAGAGTWAAVAGFLAGQVWFTVASLRVARFRPAWHWSRPLAADVLRYGFGYASSSWLLLLAGLVNPLVVGRYVGPSGVAYVALATRLVDTLASVKRATMRLAMVALAKVQRDLDRLRRAQAEGMVLQLLGVGPVLGVFSALAPWLVPAVFGPEWEPVVDLFPLIALNVLVGTVFNLHNSALHVLRHNVAVVRMRVAQLGVLVVASVVLVPSIGITGYGVGEALRSVAFGLTHFEIRRIYRPDYRPALPWLVAVVPPLFAAWCPLPWNLVLFLPAVVVLAVPGNRRTIRTYASFALGSLRPGRTAPAAPTAS